MALPLPRWQSHDERDGRRVSIHTCVVTHNRLAYTQRCVTSLLRTQRPGDSLVVVDNASGDGTVEWLTSVGVRVIRNAENRYPGAACNQGWHGATATYLHRSDNDIEYHDGWADEVERAFADWPDLALLGILNLHEDHGDPPPDAHGIVPVPRVGGNVVMPVYLFLDGLRWWEGDWAPGQDEDGPMSWSAKRHGMVAHLARTVADNMAFGRYDDYPDYYDRTAAARGFANARGTV